MLSDSAAVPLVLPTPPFWDEMVDGRGALRTHWRNVAAMLASLPPGRPILEALLELTMRVRDEFTCRAGVTTLATPVTQMLASRTGVCQDFAHLTIAGLRWLGPPIRMSRPCAA